MNIREGGGEVAATKFNHGVQWLQHYVTQKNAPTFETLPLQHFWLEDHENYEFYIKIRFGYLAKDKLIDAPKTHNTTAYSYIDIMFHFTPIRCRCKWWRYSKHCLLVWHTPIPAKAASEMHSASFKKELEMTRMIFLLCLITSQHWSKVIPPVISSLTRIYILFSYIRNV